MSTGPSTVTYRRSAPTVVATQSVPRWVRRTFRCFTDPRSAMKRNVPSLGWKCTGTEWIHPSSAMVEKTPVSGRSSSSSRSASVSGRRPNTSSGSDIRRVKIRHLGLGNGPSEVAPRVGG